MYLESNFSTDVQVLPKETKELFHRDRTVDDRFCDESMALNINIQSGTKSKPMVRNPDCNLSQRSDVHLARNEKRVLRQHNLVFVTPSPKLPIDTIESKKTSNDEDLKEMQSARNNVVAAMAETDSILASPFLGGPSNAHRQSVRDDFSKRQDTFGSSFEGTSDHAAFSDVALVGIKASHEGAFSPRIANSVSQEGRTFHRTGSQTAWKREKLQQHRTQQRAFVSKKDNPFSDFRCDPNDAENALDNLSSMPFPSSNQIIPAEGLKALDRAYLETVSPYEGSHLTAHCSRSGFSLPERARRGAVLRNLSTNVFQMSHSAQSGLERGDFASYSDVSRVNDQMVVNSGPYQLRQHASQLDDSWYGQPRGDYYSLTNTCPSNQYPTPAGDHQNPHTFNGGYRSHGGHREENVTSPAVRKPFAVNRDTGPHHLHEGISGSSTTLNDFQRVQYHHGWD